MYYDNTMKRIRQAGFILSLLIAFILVSGGTAQAQWRDQRYERNDRYDRYDRDYRYTSLDRAREIGYRDGLNDGQDAAREGDRYHPENSGDYRKGTNGYDDDFGSKSAYKSAYRQAYLRGYREGYNSNGYRRPYRRDY